MIFNSLKMILKDSSSSLIAVLEKSCCSCGDQHQNHLEVSLDVASEKGGGGNSFWHLIGLIAQNPTQQHTLQWAVNSSLSVIEEKCQLTGAKGTRSPSHTACKIKNGRKGAPKWLTGPRKMSTLRFLGTSSTFAIQVF